MSTPVVFSPLPISVPVVASSIHTTPSVVPPSAPYSWKNGKTRQVYITDPDQADAELLEFRGPCGIDIEWKPNFIKGQRENPVALVQLANSETILLLHICHMKRFPQQLRTVLEDSNVVKAGVGIQGDAKKLYNDCSVDVRNCVDLSLLARSVDNIRWKGRYKDPIGLARLIATYEDRLLSKGKVTRSNWENYLDPEQREYASNDGHAGHALYIRLIPMLSAMQKRPDSTCYTFDSIRGRLCEPSGMTWSPYNPDYDPGPPPPSRVAAAPRRPPIERRSSVPPIETLAFTSVMPIPSSSPSGSGFRRKRPLVLNSSSSGISSSALPRNQVSEDSMPTATRKRHRKARSKS
ncbi:ribonuclease H-like domain-containing protein [Mycena vitilis]|nr:ribonuclease H-like domain-containing protein [Mycena vitilis]